MPDTHVLLASFRDELEVLDGRRSELSGQLERVDSERERLATTISFLEERIGAAPAADDSGAGVVPGLAERILDSLGSSGIRRPDLLRIFERQGFTSSAVDSAVSRLQEKGFARRDRGRVVRVSPQPPPTDPPPPASGAAPLREADAPRPLASGAAAGGGGSPPASGTPVAGTGGSSSADGGPDSVQAGSGVEGGAGGGAGRPFAREVFEAIRDGVDTRGALHARFVPLGIKGKKVDDTVKGLRRRGAVERLSPGRYAVVVKRGSTDPVE